MSECIREYQLAAVEAYQSLLLPYRATRSPIASLRMLCGLFGASYWKPSRKFGSLKKGWAHDGKAATSAGSHCGKVSVGTGPAQDGRYATANIRRSYAPRFGIVPGPR